MREQREGVRDEWRVRESDKSSARTREAKERRGESDGGQEGALGCKRRAQTSKGRSVRGRNVVQEEGGEVERREWKGVGRSKDTGKCGAEHTDGEGLKRQQGRKESVQAREDGFARRKRWGQGGKRLAEMEMGGTKTSREESGGEVDTGEHGACVRWSQGLHLPHSNSNHTVMIRRPAELVIRVERKCWTF